MTEEVKPAMKAGMWQMFFDDMGLVYSREEQVFLELLKENPFDDTTRLVYADWLDEHDKNARADLLRTEVSLAGTRPDTVDYNGPIALAFDRIREEEGRCHFVQWARCAGRRYDVVLVATKRGRRHRALLMDVLSELPEFFDDCDIEAMTRFSPTVIAEKVGWDDAHVGIAGWIHLALGEDVSNAAPGANVDDLFALHVCFSPAPAEEPWGRFAVASRRPWDGPGRNKTT